jgi:hypothetical protein
VADVLKASATLLYSFFLKISNKMELSHAISDSVLTLTGLFVFFSYLKKINPTERLLWSAFILPLTVAAFFGAIRFWGYAPARAVSEVFQHLAGTAGAICLVVAAYLLVTQKSIARNYVLGAIGVGTILFLWVQISNNASIVQKTSMIVIPVALVLGIWGVIKGKTLESRWLIAGVLILVMATFNKIIAANLNLDGVDIYHYLLAISILCLGKASSLSKASSIHGQYLH